MSIMEIVRFTFGTLFLVAGIIVFLIEVFGIFKFKYILDRMHAAAMGDTMGILLCMIGLCFYSGFNFTTAKIILVILLFWVASPVTSHMTALLELYTNPRLDKHLCYDGSLEKLENKLKDEKELENREPSSDEE